MVNITRLWVVNFDRLLTDDAKVHPHMCGENEHIRYSKQQYKGPSPRVWGKLLFDSFYQFTGRSIPTCVGKTDYLNDVEESEEVHPHVCGENSTATLVAQRIVGPSPRVWGKLIVNRNRINDRRSIPTCVGKTVWTGRA